MFPELLTFAVPLLLSFIVDVVGLLAYVSALFVGCYELFLGIKRVKDLYTCYVHFPGTATRFIIAQLISYPVRTAQY